LLIIKVIQAANFASRERQPMNGALLAFRGLQLDDVSVSFSAESKQRRL